MILDYAKLRKEFEAKKKRERREKFKKYEIEEECSLSEEEKEDIRRKQLFWDHLLKKKKI